VRSAASSPARSPHPDMGVKKRLSPLGMPTCLYRDGFSGLDLFSLKKNKLCTWYFYALKWSNSASVTHNFSQESRNIVGKLLGNAGNHVYL
jgi:hypothetical protein